MKTVGKLYMSKTSPAVRSVLFTVKALGISLEYINLDMKQGEHLKPDFIKINPQHTVPTYVDDDGTIVWDSHAIMSFLVEKHSNPNEAITLYPANLAQRAVINQRLFFEASVVYPTLRGIVLPLVQQKLKTPSTEALQEAQTVYDFLEVFLADHKFLAGQNLTIADFSIITTLTALDYFVPIDEAKHPKVAKWVNSCKELPYYNEANEGLQQFKEFIQGLTGAS